VNFDDLYQEYALMVHRRACYLLADPEMAADVEQQTWINVWRSLDTLKPENVRGWLLMIVTNAARDAVRTQKNRAKYLAATTLEAYTERFEEAPEVADPVNCDPLEQWIAREEQTVLEEQRQALYQGIARLRKPKHRQALLCELNCVHVADRQTLYEAKRYLVAQMKRTLIPQDKQELTLAEKLERIREICARSDKGEKSTALAEEYKLSPRYIRTVVSQHRRRQA
jgi:RNA polymerase sigma factor (sigma-70 family)